MQDNDVQNDMDSEQPTPRRHFAMEEMVFIPLVLLSLIGIAITSFSTRDGYAYWLLMVLVFGVLSIVVSWLQAKNNASNFSDTIKEGLHWLHTLIIVVASSLLHKSGHLSDIGFNLVILLILALATMLDGMRTGWQFTLLGFFLAACAIIVAYVEAFIWVCVGLALLVVIGTFLWGLKAA